MKVLFVYTLNRAERPSKPLSSPEQINFGISYISGLLKKYNHETRLVVLCSNYETKSLEVIHEIISEFQPEVIGFYIIASEYHFVDKVCIYVRHFFPSIYLIAGGPHVSIKPEDVIKSPFDSICIGEGEYPTLELIQYLNEGKKPSSIENLWIKNGDKIQKNLTRNFLINLDELPFPDRDIWFEWIEEKADARFSILLGRGCPFKCTYCCNHVLSKISNGKYVRFRSPKNILEEIKYLHKRFPEKRQYFFEVETFNLNKKWTYELCGLLKEYNDSLANPLTFGTNIRITPKGDFEDMFYHCSKANIRKFTVGLESGNERIRSEVLNRFYSNDDVIRMANQARKYGCEFGFQNMIGLPHETEKDFMDTVEVNRICQPDWYYLSNFFPYPGTKLADLCEEMGLLKGKIDYNCERQKAVIDYPTFSKKKIQKRFLLFEYDVYKGEKPLYKIIARIIVRVLYSYKVTSKIYGYIKQNKVIQKVILILKS